MKDDGLRCCHCCHMCTKKQQLYRESLWACEVGVGEQEPSQWIFPLGSKIVAR